MMLVGFFLFFFFKNLERSVIAQRTEEIICTNNLKIFIIFVITSQGINEREDRNKTVNLRHIKEAIKDIIGFF